jgi:hypothetical protein
VFIRVHLWFHRLSQEAAKRQGAGPTRADDVIAASKPAGHLRIVK